MRGQPYSYDLVGNYGNFHFGISIAEKEFVALLFGGDGHAKIFFYDGLNTRRRVVYVMKLFGIFNQLIG